MCNKRLWWVGLIRWRAINLSFSIYRYIKIGRCVCVYCESFLFSDEKICLIDIRWIDSDDLQDLREETRVIEFEWDSVHDAEFTFVQLFYNFKKKRTRGDVYYLAEKRTKGIRTDPLPSWLFTRPFHLSPFFLFYFFSPFSRTREERRRQTLITGRLCPSTRVAM